MAIRTAVIPTSTGAAALLSEDTDNRYGQSIAVRNTGAVTVYVGGADVTTADGWALEPAAELSVDLTPGELLYAVSATAGQVHTLRVGA